MKILAVQIQNIASLRGTFEINFQKFFQCSNVVLIHGPTGAGKTTILDAISLAIFGQTARSSSNNISDHIMTTGEGSCTASVLIDIQREPSMDGLEIEDAKITFKKGIYRFTWNLKRAREQAQGNLQHPEFFIDRMKTVDFDGEVAQTVFADRKVKTWRKYVSNILGNLTFEDFARSCFLFQSEYSQFLTASPMQKASLLATLTHTEYFKDIGEKITQHFRDQEARLQVLQNTTRNHLSTEQITQIQDRIIELEDAIEKTSKDLLQKQGELQRVEEIHQNIINYETCFFQWAESLAGKISQDRAKALEKDRKLRHLETPLQNFQVSKQQYEEMMRQGGEQLLTTLHLQNIDISSDLFLKLNAILQNIENDMLLTTTDLIQLEKAAIDLDELSHIQKQIEKELEMLEKEQHKKQAIQQQIQELQDQLSDKITKKAQLQSLLLYSKIAPMLLISLEKTSEKVDLDEVKQHQDAFEMWQQHLKNCGLQRKSIPEVYNLTIFEELHHKLIEKLLSRSREYEVAKHEFEIQKTNHSDMILQDQAITEEIKNREVVIAKHREQEYLVNQRIVQLVGSLDVTHIPSQIQTYRTTIAENEIKYKFTQKLLQTLQNYYVRQQDLFRGLEEQNISLEHLEASLLPSELREREEKRYAKHVDQNLVEELNQYKIELRPFFSEEILNDKEKILAIGEDYKTQIHLLQNSIHNLHASFIEETRQRQMLDQKIEDHKNVDIENVHEKNHIKSQRNNLDILHQMLGSRRAGKNLRVLFEEKAQAYNLQRFIQLTNQHVHSLTEGRYELKPRFDNGRPTTDFKIQDHTQFSERDIVSLSGGETFLLSVGLALGIGELQYNYEPIESLFIDEGFGALDEESLHLVTNTLRKLSQRLNKQIILISHVPQLRQEYPVRIEVLKNADGSSVIKKHVPSISSSK